MTYKIQIDDTVRSATEEEIVDLENKAAVERQALINRDNAKQSAINKLKALGLTDSEISALVS